MMRVKTVLNFSSTSGILFITTVCLGLVLGCSGDVNGPEINISGSGAGGGIPHRDIDFTAEKTIETNIPVGGCSSLEIMAINGTVAVTGNCDIDDISLTARLVVGSDSQSDADRYLEDLEIEVTASSESIVLQTVHPKDTGGRQYRVEYNIVVPIDLAVLTNQANGNIDIHDIQNSVDVINVNGDIQLIDIVGGVAADVVNGCINASVTLPVHATIDLIVDNGSIDLRIPRSTSAIMDAFVVRGTIHTTNLVFDELVQTDRSLTGTLGGGNGNIELWVDVGNVAVTGLY
jgi:hypothetical protein